MRKMKLRADELRVESFATVVGEEERGTVRGNSGDEQFTHGSTWCWTDPTADPSWQEVHTCPECAPMETPDGPCW